MAASPSLHTPLGVLGPPRQPPTEQRAWLHSLKGLFSPIHAGHVRICPVTTTHASQPGLHACPEGAGHRHGRWGTAGAERGWWEQNPTA